MPQAQGRSAIIGYQAESTFGADPGTPTLVKLYFESESLKASRNLITSNVITGTRNPSQPIQGNVEVSGSISTELQPYIGTLLKALMGSNTTSGASPYTHVMKVGNALGSFVIEKGFTDLTTPEYFKYNGCKINKFSLEASPEGFQKISFDFMGTKETASTTSFDATLTDLGKSSFGGFQAAILEGGGAIANVSKVSLSIENNIEGQYVIGGAGLKQSLNAGTVKVSGSIDALFEDMTLLTKAINTTESSLKITYTSGTGAGTAGNESIEFLIPELFYKQDTPTVSGDKGVMVTLSFEAFYTNSTETSAVQITLKNTQATI